MTDNGNFVKIADTAQVVTLRIRFTNEHKTWLADAATKLGKRKICEIFGIKRQSMDLWASQIDDLRTKTPNKKTDQKCVPRFPIIEGYVVRKIIELRAVGVPVTLKVVLEQAKQFQNQETCSEKEKKARLSSSWAYLVMKRAGFCSRAITTSGNDPLPNIVVAESFHRLCKNICSGFSASLILNMDEISVHYENVPQRSYEKMGSKKVAVRTSGATKKNITVALTISAAGEWLPAYAILKRKTIPSNLEVPRVYVSANETSWMSSSEFIKFIKYIVMPYAQGRNVILIVDCATSHKIDPVLYNEFQGLTILQIPKGQTGNLQPLDVGINKPFRSKMQASWLDRNVRLAQQSGRKIPVPSHVELLGWVSEAMSKIPSDMIIKSWIRSGFTYLNLVGSDGNMDDIQQNLEEEFSAFKITNGDSDQKSEN